MRKILISAYGCEPNKGSEPGVGWHWVLEMAKTEELWVITRRNNQSSIESALLGAIAEHVHFIYYDPPKWLAKLKNKDRGLYLYYACWQWGAYLLAKKLSGKIHFDYCMHLTFGSLWMPTFMYKLPIPFIWGPVGGGESVPSTYIKNLPWAGRFAQHVRRFLIHLAKLNPFFMGPTRAAKAIIARTEDSKRVFPNKYQNKVSVMLETGMSADMFQQYQSNLSANGFPTVEMVCSGRLIPIKNIEMAIRALAMIHQSHTQVRLTIIGDGPLRLSLRALAQKLGVQDKVRCLGVLSRDEAIQILQKSHLFLFPSLKEGGSWALMEAMVIGLPIICIDTSGMHVITDDECAIRIPPINFEDSVRRMADGIVRLAESPGLRREMGDAARTRIEGNFMWCQKGVFMSKLLSDLDAQAAGSTK